jgi:hypothetical protein
MKSTVVEAKQVEYFVCLERFMDLWIVSLAERRIGLTACIRERGSVNKQRHCDIVSDGEIHGESSLIADRAFLCAYELQLL